MSTNAADAGGRAVSSEEDRSVAPALERYTRAPLRRGVEPAGARPPRPHSLALIVGGQACELGYYANEALENGVTPAELSETIVHLAHYSGRGNAMAAIAPVSAVFAQRGIGMDELQD
jgi:4-carboxymuconolactone decarboxylase